MQRSARKLGTEPSAQIKESFNLGRVITILASVEDKKLEAIFTLDKILSLFMDQKPIPFEDDANGIYYELIVKQPQLKKRFSKAMFPAKFLIEPGDIDSIKKTPMTVIPPMSDRQIGEMMRQMGAPESVIRQTMGTAGRNYNPAPKHTAELKPKTSDAKKSKTPEQEAAEKVQKAKAKSGKKLKKQQEKAKRAEKAKEDFENIRQQAIIDQEKEKIALEKKKRDAEEKRAAAAKKKISDAEAQQKALLAKAASQQKSADAKSAGKPNKKPEDRIIIAAPKSPVNHPVADAAPDKRQPDIKEPPQGETNNGNITMSPVPPIDEVQLLNKFLKLDENFPRVCISQEGVRGYSIYLSPEEQKKLTQAGIPFTPSSLPNVPGGISDNCVLDFTDEVLNKLKSKPQEEKAQLNHAANDKNSKPSKAGHFANGIPYPILLPNSHVTGAPQAQPQEGQLQQPAAQQPEDEQENHLCFYGS